MNKYNSLGYTLLEIMIALAVFAIVATISASAMYQAFDTRARVNVQADQLNTIQLALSFITKDTEQIVERATLGNEMHTFAPFIGQTHYVEFTRSGFVNPTQELRSTLQRVAYLCTNEKLIRRSWHHLDIPKRDEHEDRIIFDNVDACEFAYLSHSHQTLSEWQAYAVQQNQNRTTSPIAIQMSITLRHLGNMNLLFPIPEALYAAK